jgi:hypothetical protein
MNHDLLNDVELRGKAEAHCREAVAQVSKAECRVDVSRGETEWDDEDQRFVYEYEATLWLAGPSFDVIVDDAGRGVGYVDHSKWRACSWKPLTRERVLALASETGYVPKTAGIIGFARGEKGCIEVRFLTDPRDAASTRYVSKVNPVLEKIISILPEGVEL